VSSPLLFFMLPPPPLSPLFPYTTLFRSLDLDLLFRTDDLPRIRAAKPVVGLLVLPTVLDGLPEHPVLVPEPIPYGRELHRGHRVEEACGQAPEPAIAQPGVGLFFEQAEPIECCSLDEVAHDGT